MRFLFRLLVSAVAIFGVSYLSGGLLLEVRGFGTALLLALVLIVVNALVKPLVSLISLPITILTLGLFSLVINTAMLALAAWLVPGVQTTGFWATLVSALIISVVTSVFTGLIDKEA